MKTLCIAGLLSVLIMQPLDAADSTTDYRVEIEVYVSDAQALCKQAWSVALPDHGPAITEMLTMTRGEFLALKCLATSYQKRSPDGVVSAGIHVVEVQP
jgi:hypothetical protein